MLSYLNAAPWKLCICKISQKSKNAKNLRQKLPYLGFFGLEFKKTIVLFEISTIKFAYFINLAKNQKA